MRRRTWLQAGFLAALPHCQKSFASGALPRQPIESFARRPLMEWVSLSPDGHRLAALINSGNRTVLVTRAVSGGAVQSVLGTDNLEFVFRWFRWLNNERLVLSLRFPSRRQIGYVQTVPTMESRLLAVNADGSQLVNLVKERRSTSDVLRWAVRQDKVVDFLPKDGQHLLLALPSSETEYEHAVYKVNCYTGERSHYSGTRRDIYDWITDSTHRVRIGLGYTETSDSLVWVCDPDGSNWRELSKAGPFARNEIEPLGFGLDPNMLYVRAQHAGLKAVQLIDLKEPTIAPRLVYADPHRDVGAFLIRDPHGEVVGVGGSSLGDSSARFWDSRYKQWQQEIDQALPGSFNEIVGNCADGQSLVVSSEQIGKPGSYYIASVGDKPSLSLTAQTYPELENIALGRKVSIRFKARDGLEIHGYLTKPAGVAHSDRLPMVLFPHGGPQSLDGPEFDHWAAFMADRGYAVLQVNFRGSTGYGQAFMEAGLRKWGLEMQDDLSDAVAEMVQRGIADPARIAIVGASYGGYAALMGVIKTPTLFCGAFAFAPVTDLVELTGEEGQYSARETVRRQIGDARDDRKQLEETSPRRLAQRVQVPVVLIHGTHDRQVPPDHSLWMAQALKEHGKDHKYVSLDKGDHQLSHLPYRKLVFAELEGFLDRVLAPKAA